MNLSLRGECCAGRATTVGFRSEVANKLLHGENGAVKTSFLCHHAG